MKRDRRMARLVPVGLMACLPASCGSSETSGSTPAAELVKQESLTRVQSATTVLASDRHVFRFDGRSYRTFTMCHGTVSYLPRIRKGQGGGCGQIGRGFLWKNRPLRPVACRVHS